MAGYLGAIPVPQATQHRESFTATSGQTTFNTAGYTVGFLDVYLNGSHLSPADFTATNGSDVVLASGASTGDVCDIISYTAFEVADQTFTGTTTLTGNLLLGDNDKAIFGAGSDLQIYHDGSNSFVIDQGTGGLVLRGSTFVALQGTNGENAVIASENGAVDLRYDNATKLATTSTGIDITGGFTSNAASTISTADNTDTLTLISTDADANAGPNLRMYRNSGSPAAADVLGVIDYEGRNDSSEDVIYVNITAQANDVSNGSEDGSYYISTMLGGTLYNRMNVLPTETVFNQDSVDLDFRVESNGNANMLFVDGGNNRVGIGVNDPDAVLDISAGANILGLLRVTQRLSGAAAYGLDVGLDPTLGDPVFSRIVNDVVTEAFRIQRSSGNILVGTTSVPTSSGVGIGLQADASGAFLARRTSTTNNNSAALFYNPNGLVGSIQTSGSATSFNTSSDYRLKTDAQPMTGASARVQALNPVNFEWISSGERVDGFLAHEAQAVVPESVTGTKDAMRDEEYEVTPAVLDADGNETKPAVMGTRSVPDMQGIDQSKLVPLLVAALQEALARITALENA